MSSLNNLIESLREEERLEEGSGAKRSFNQIRDLSRDLEASAKHIWSNLEKTANAVDRYVADEKFDKHATGLLGDAAKKIKRAQAAAKEAADATLGVASYVHQMKGRRR